MPIYRVVVKKTIVEHHIVSAADRETAHEKVIGDDYHHNVLVKSREEEVVEIKEI
jgi:hypothetical protein